MLGLTTLGNHCILQELLAYGLTEARSIEFCSKMQIRIIDVLLHKIYCTKEHFLERSRVLIRKAGALRASGVENIKNCLESLRDAISLLVSLDHILPFVIYKEGRYRLMFVHLTSKRSHMIQLVPTLLQTISWPLRTVCMRSVLRKTNLVGR